MFFASWPEVLSGNPTKRAICLAGDVCVHQRPVGCQDPGVRPEDRRQLSKHERSGFLDIAEGPHPRRNLRVFGLGRRVDPEYGCGLAGFRLGHDALTQLDTKDR